VFCTEPLEPLQAQNGRIDLCAIIYPAEPRYNPFARPISAARDRGRRQLPRQTRHWPHHGLRRTSTTRCWFLSPAVARRSTPAIGHGPFRDRGAARGARKTASEMREDVGLLCPSGNERPIFSTWKQARLGVLAVKRPGQYRRSRPLPTRTSCEPRTNHVQKNWLSRAQSG
jgi:hypothetical protein